MLKKSVLFLFTFLLFAYFSFCQKSDTLKHILNFNGSVSVTNNGFSFVPSFSLGKPAAIFGFNLNGGKRFSFEPELRFSLEGKPWSFIFISRYKLINTSKFQLTLGTHLPAISFRTVPVIKDGISLDVIQAQRFFPVLELMPNYAITKDISVGMFYLYGHSLESDAAQNNLFISFRTSFSNIKISNQYFLRFNPQIFYLKSDKNDGFYTSANLTMAKRNFPFSISSMMNKAIKTDIKGKDFDWNVSLVYSFGKKYVRK
jgi:hypothetical protein